ncbi:MAG: aminoacetone oxidase family FAD-binding enzyme, partial [Prevotella sp.]|nr:aminoacetone oxidase family FAD-binding enzyme [Prevotella sp.]
ARRHQIEIRTECRVESLDELADFDFIAVTTGGSPKPEGLHWLSDFGHEIASPVPSLFTFHIDDERLQALMGTVVENATAYIPSTSYRASGPLLITHWGMSGPAILKLSSYAARHLAEHNYRQPLAVNWLSQHDEDIKQQLLRLTIEGGKKQLASIHPESIPARLWTYLINKALGQRAQSPWMSMNKKEINRLTNTLANDTYEIAGRAAFKDEFVTCGGIALDSVNPATLESRHVPHLYFAGEVLDIDGITGGFNFQAAWTTAYTVAQSICR